MKNSIISTTFGQRLALSLGIGDTTNQDLFYFPRLTVLSITAHAECTNRTLKTTPSAHGSGLIDKAGIVRKKFAALQA